MIDPKKLNIPFQVLSPRLVLSKVSENDLKNFYEAFIESFDSLTEYYSPSWSQFEELPSKEKIENYLSKSSEIFKDKPSFLFSAFDKKEKFIGQCAAPKGGVHI